MKGSQTDKFYSILDRIVSEKWRGWPEFTLPHFIPVTKNQSLSFPIAIKNLEFSTLYLLIDIIGIQPVLYLCFITRL
jgi:hypothetical protein